MDPNASPTVRIKYPANLRCGYCQIPAGDFDPDVHELWADGASVKAAPPATLSDDEMRDVIEAKTGKRPHHKLGREKLVAAFNEFQRAG